MVEFLKISLRKSVHAARWFMFLKALITDLRTNVTSLVLRLEGTNYL